MSIMVTPKSAPDNVLPSANAPDWITSHDCLHLCHIWLMSRSIKVKSCNSFSAKLLSFIVCHIVLSSPCRSFCLEIIVHVLVSKFMLSVSFAFSLK